MKTSVFRLASLSAAITVAAATLGALPASASASDPYPSLSSVSPSTGSTAGGDTITISGSGFTSDADGPVTIQNVYIGPDCNGSLAPFASFQVVDDTTITAVTPSHAAGTIQVNVGFSDPLQTSAVLRDTVPYTFGNIVSVPSVTSVSPNSGPVTGGTNVDIRGSGFTGATMVLFGGFTTPPTSFTVVSDSEIEAVSPPSAFGTGGVHIQVCLPSWGFSHQVPADVFQYAAADTTPPTISCPAGITQVTGPAGTATVDYAATASDPDSSFSLGYNPASGSAFSLGSTQVTATATDPSGNSSSCSFTVTVVYAFSGFEAPISNPNVVNTGKSGKTYPVKWQLQDASGDYFSSLSAVTGVVYSSTACSNFTTDPTSALQTTASGGTSLRYDSTTNQYVYNWSTPGPGCYTLFLELNSGQVFPAFFSLS